LADEEVGEKEGVGDHAHRIPIGPGFVRQIAVTDDASATGPVLDAELVAELLFGDAGHGAGGDVHAATYRIGDDEADGPGRIVVGYFLCRGERHHDHRGHA